MATALAGRPRGLLVGRAEAPRQWRVRLARQPGRVADHVDAVLAHGAPELRLEHIGPGREDRGPLARREVEGTKADFDAEYRDSISEWLL
jgi:hypothetical protein